MNAPRKLSEQLLLYKIKAHRDPEAFAKLYDLYIEKIYRFTFFKVSNKEEAEDITSDIFLKAWNYLTSKKSEKVQSFGGLIYTIARNTIVDFYRKKGKRKECSIDQMPEIVVEDTMLSSVALQHDMDNVLRCIKKMKQHYQEVLLLRYLDELSIAEIAELLSKRKTNIRVMLHRAIKVLQAILEEEAKK